MSRSCEGWVDLHGSGLSFFIVCASGFEKASTNLGQKDVGYLYSVNVSYTALRCTKSHLAFSHTSGLHSDTLPQHLEIPSLLLLLHLGLPLLQHLIHNAKLQRLTRIHKIVPLHILFNLLERPRLGQMPLIYPIQLVPHPQDLLCMVRDIARLPTIPPARLVDHHPAVRQNVPLPRGPTRQQQRAHRRRLPHADGRHRAPDVVHRVVDGHARGDGAPRRVYVQGYGLRGVVGFEEEELRGYGGGHGVVDFAVERDDALGEEAREDVRGFPAAGLGGVLE